MKHKIVGQKLCVCVCVGGQGGVVSRFVVSVKSDAINTKG